MSNFNADFKNKKTGKVESVHCADNYFAHYEYGYIFKDNTVLNLEELDAEWVRVEKQKEE